MSWISALGPLQWILLAAIPPAVLSLYFLKLKRREIAVPSTLLWRRTIEDLHVNSIWQKLRQNLLMYLQLLFLLLLILACLRPGWSGMTSIGERRIYLIDNSASMQSTDISPNRLAVAKQKVKDLISSADDTDVGMVIAFSDRADVKQGFTSDKKRLMAAIDAIEPTNHSTDIGEALRAASGLANPGRSSFGSITDVQVAEALPAKVYLLSDGGFPELGDFDLGRLVVDYTPIGELKTPNVGILSFSVQRMEGKSDTVEAFARVVNHGDEKVEFNASLELNGKLIDAAKGTAEAGKESGLLFEVSGVDEGMLKLEIDSLDALEVDNVAYAAIRPNRQVNVLLLTQGNNSLETALKTERVQRIAAVRVESPQFLTQEAYETSVRDAEYDLIIYDQCSPSRMPKANTLFIGSVPPMAAVAKADTAPESVTPADGTPAENATEKSARPASDDTLVSGWEFGPLTGPVFIADVNRTNPITEFLEMASVTIVETRTVKPPENGVVLMTSDMGPVCAVAPRGPYQDAVVGFGMIENTAEGLAVNSDWGIKRSFPVFVYSAVDYLGGGITEASAPSVQPGWPIGLLLSNRFDEYRVELPNGKSTELTRGKESRFLFTQTDDLGVYRVYAKGTDVPVESFCSNLFSTRESKLDVEPSVSMGYEKVAASSTKIRARQETWRWLLILGFGFLMFEWVVFNRRIFV